MILATTGFLVIRRVNYFTEERFRPVDRFPALGLSHEEVLRRYRGFEGEPWPESPGLKKIVLNDGLASLDQYKAVLDYFRQVNRQFQCDLLCLRFLINQANDSPHCDFNFVGFDFGFYSSEFNHFSVLFHEVVYGEYNELRECVQLLNANLLLPTHADSECLEQKRTKLVASGADLETDDDGEGFVPIAIFALKNEKKVSGTVLRSGEREGKGVRNRFEA